MGRRIIVSFHASAADRAALDWMLQQQPGWESAGHVLRSALFLLASDIAQFPGTLLTRMHAERLSSRPASLKRMPLFNESGDAARDVYASYVPLLPDQQEQLLVEGEDRQSADSQVRAQVDEALEELKVHPVEGKKNEPKFVPKGKVKNGVPKKATRKVRPL